ncbi:MAG TPA: Mut7-C RNAse domain-containing protein, partial [Bryobacteraceae bacterium]|nr:Mut7-C RNAse domain-containing protein [Bryobacteraceae bacterium]
RVVFRPRALPISLNSHRFVLDGHLGRLAAFLRMLGFDVWYDRFADDLLLASVASSEQRLLLTRDVALLKRREIEAGYWIRSHKPHDQLIEVTRRFALHSGFTPFKRCMDCNGLLQPVSKQEVVSIVPRYIRETKEDFSRCSACGKVFWRGTHYTRMRTLIAQLTP